MVSSEAALDVGQLAEEANSPIASSVATSPDFSNIITGIPCPVRPPTMTLPMGGATECVSIWKDYHAPKVQAFLNIYCWANRTLIVRCVSSSFSFVADVLWWTPVSCSRSLMVDAETSKCNPSRTATALVWGLAAISSRIRWSSTCWNVRVFVVTHEIMDVG